MIKTLIFDFGNVFINLDLEGAVKNAFDIFEIDEFSEEMIAFNSFYEQGLISTDEFIDFYIENFPKLTKDELIDIWNFMLKDFPKYRLDFLKQLKSESQYKIILLSNTNDLHISYIKEQISFYEEFKNCFDAFYLSHDIQLRKPNKNIFEFILIQHNIEASECLFIDDTLENIKTASELNMNVWHLNPKIDDVVNLLEANKTLF